ncbi:MAG: DUF695 domain-containing protein [Duncaniella sp.]|uniref:DUF695 domain-containing protein n=1 Tax=Duncaniella sp. TaxID=2518496 RepID=UPI0019984F37|nr:DUF695 domain-containing protein [Duncaniella sp.]MBD5314232.1 DUF695 domain-containing protein [Bacteroides sp.]MBD5335661.1 DUF695 domain-containing protein [Bacteroides sp.]MDE6090066.1 DUF695 domain-containing protein [Duncaniella sp.]
MDNENWWTAPTESESGKLIMVTGRKDVEKFRSNPRFNIRVEVTWKYDGDASGMPDKETSTLMEEVQEALQKEFKKDPVAVLTGIFTGDNQRDWIFYTLSTHIFGRKLNESLASFPLLPLTIYTENDPGWEEYDEMSEAEIKMD